MKWSQKYAAMIFFLLLVGCQRTKLVSFVSLRKPSAFDLLMESAACRMDAPSLCEKISPKAFLSAGFASSGHQIKLLKSKCYYDIAMITKNSQLCGQVKPIRTLWVDGSKYSPKECRSAIEKGYNYGCGYPPEEEDMAKIMKSMGYTVEHIRATYLKSRPQSTENQWNEIQHPYVLFFLVLCDSRDQSEKDKFVRRAEALTPPKL